jgi:predicted TIM-barrel fold metal-dependent hydrolase
MGLHVSRMPFTDTHVHFFDMREPELAYDFLGPGGDPDRTAFVGVYSAMRAERYWADDSIAETRFQNVERVVHMQASCIEAFGADHAFFGTNWPVDRIVSSDGDALDAYDESCLTFPTPSSARCSAAPQTEFFEWRERGRRPSLLTS